MAGRFLFEITARLLGLLANPFFGSKGLLGMVMLKSS